MKKVAECDCVNPNTCEDCCGRAYVSIGKTLPSDVKIAADKHAESVEQSEAAFSTSRECEDSLH